MRASALALSLFVALLLGGVQSAAAAPCNPTQAVCAGLECAVIGATQMDFDQKNILACLLGDSGNKMWKSMTVQATAAAAADPVATAATTPTTTPVPTATTPVTPTCTPNWQDASACTASGSKKQSDGCGNTKTVACVITAIGGGNCTPYVCKATGGYGCGGGATAALCPSTWIFWGTGKGGGCSSGTSTYGADGISFTCYAYK